MLLAIDIDNNYTNCGIFNENKLVDSFSLTTEKNKAKDEIKLLLKLILADKNIDINSIDDIIISSVIPELYPIYSKISHEIIGKNPIIISSGVKTGLNIRCENPKDVGSDRIIRAVGGNYFYPGNVIIISASPITTIDFISEKKEFLGGLILPGIDLLQNSLIRESAKIPDVKIEKAKKILGNSTSKAVQNGIYFSYNYAIRGIIEDIFHEHKLKKENTRILTTGPNAYLLDYKNYNLIDCQNLGLYGLSVIYKLNKNL